MVRGSRRYQSILKCGNGGGRVYSMVVEINIIKDKTLCSHNRTVIEAIQMIVQLRVKLCPVKMVQLDIYNTTTIMNGYIFQIISLKFLLIISVAEAADLVEVHVLEKDPTLECYRFSLVFLRTLM